MRKSLIALVMICFFISSTMIMMTNVNGLANSGNSSLTQTLSTPVNSNNGTLTNLISPPVSPSDTLNVTHFGPATLTPILEHYSNGTAYYATPSLAQGQSIWQYLTLWSDGAGGCLPTFMEGSFTAVQLNTISGLNSNDQIIYEPINICYGTSSSYVWYQFVINYEPGYTPTFGIWDFQNGNMQTGQGRFLSLTYTVGHVYNFALTTSGTNTVVFTLTDVTTQTPDVVNSWWYTPPNLNIIWNTQGCYSPASAVEGYTTNSQLTNVPFFLSFIGTGQADATYDSLGSGQPSGISQACYGPASANGYTGYYWAMTGYQYLSSIITSQTGGIGKGSVSNPTNIVGTQQSNYATIYGGNPGDGGTITGQMNVISGDKIYIYGCSVSGYYSNLYVYVSMDDSTWYQVGSYITITSTTPYWIYVGQYFSSFNYISIVGYDTGNSVKLHLYSVKVSN